MKTLSLKQAAKLIGYTPAKLKKLVEENRVILLEPLNPEAIADGWLFNDAKVKKFIKHSVERQGQAHVFDPHELTACLNWFLAFNKPNERKNAALVATSHYTGMRCAEIAKVKISDVAGDDWELKREMLLTAQNTKTNKARNVALYHKAFTPILERYLKDRRIAGATINDLLFVTSTGKPFSRSYLANHFKNIYARYGKPEYSSHSGRRYFITEMLSKDVPIKTAQLLAGHTSSATTAMYHQPRQDEFESAINRIG